MTIIELIRYLKDCDPDARVKALVGKESGPIEVVEQRKVITPRDADSPEHFVYLMGPGNSSQRI